MKNGKASNGNGHSPVAEEVQAVLDSEVGRPVPKAQDFHRSAGAKSATAASKWARSRPWDEWWDEFSTAIDDKGRLKYKTAWQFCKSKTKTTNERELLWEMIGPDRPEAKKLRVPWLGDWQKRRANGFWSVDSDKVVAIKQAIKERVDSIEATRPLANVLLVQLQRWMRVQQQVDEAFGGQMYLPAYAATHPKNKQRAQEYIRLQKAGDKSIEYLVQQYCQIHGLNPSDANSWLTMAAMIASGQIGAKAALTGVAAQASGKLDAGAILGELGLSKYDVLFAKDMREKGEMYHGLPEPDIIPPDKNGKKGQVV